MALANLNINVTTNVNNAVTALTDIKAVANNSMFQSSKAVNDFQKSFAKDQTAVSAQSKAMSADMKTSGAEIAKASKLSSDSIGNIKTSADASVGSIKDFAKTAEASAQPIKELSKSLDDAGKKINQAMGPETSQNVKATKDRVEEFVGTRIAIAAVGLTLGAMAATIATVGYAAYKTGGYVYGLFTGENLKTKSTDAVVEMNKQVLELQKSLQMTAADANALNDAMSRKGVNKSDITDVYGKTEALRNGGDTSELDRLGVKYKGQSGQILDTETLLKNAKKSLDEYTDGWDRNQAAIAIGLGSYDQINNYLKVNQQEIQKSKNRLNDYNLAIGPETQKVVDDYQAAMLEFKNEIKLMGDGWKRMWSDQAMPAFTAFAKMFKDEWPEIIAGTRHVVAAFTSMGYGIKMVADIAYDTVDGMIKAIGGGFGAVGAAATFALKGEFTTAKDVILAGWNDSAGKIKGIGAQIVIDAENNLKAMQLAQGRFGIDNAPAGGPSSGKKKGKKFIPKQNEEEVEDDKTGLKSDWTAARNKYLEYLKSFYETQDTMQKNANSIMESANQYAYDNGLVGLRSFLDEKHRLNMENAALELMAKKKELEDAEGALTDLKPVVDNAGEGNPSKDADHYHAALLKRQNAFIAVENARKKIADVQISDQNENITKTKDTTRSYQEQQAVLADFQGDFVKAAEIRKRLEEESLARKQIEANAAMGDMEAEKALTALKIADMEKLRQAQVNQKKILDDLRLSTPDKYGNTNAFGQRQQALGNSLGGIGAQIAANPEIAQLRRLEDQKTAIIEKSKAEQAAIQKRYDDQIVASQLDAGSKAASILSSAAGQNIALQEAALVVETGIAVARIMISTEVAKARALAELGPIAGMAMAAELQAMEYVSIGLTVGAGIVQGVNIAGKKATGGPVEAGQTYIVNENRATQGPEYFTPGVSGTITPANKVGGNNVTIHQTLHITGVAADIESNTRAIAKQAANQAKLQILNSMNRGGEFAVASGRVSR